MLLLCIPLITSLTAGCTAKVKSTAEPDKDIITMDAVDDRKITITIRAEYNISNQAILDALKAEFPDVNFVSVFHCGPETQYELRQSLSGGTAEDIVISPNMKSISDIAPDCLMDLSAESFTNCYDGTSLEDCQINGRIYYLPGPSSIYGIVYDKTLFQQNGWQVPHSYSEFLNLAETINASGIRAIQPTCKYARQAQLVFTMFNYDEVFGGITNEQWLTDFQNGSVSMNGHIDSALARYSELQDAGIITPSDFDMQPGNRSTMFYTNHSCAMIIENEQAQLYAKQAGSDHEYGMFPFWCGDDENSDKLMSIPGYYIGINKSLSEKGNEKKLAAVKDALSYISTPEGQEAINGSDSSQISNVQGTSYTENDFNKEIISTVQKGCLVPEVDLMASGNNNAAEKALKADLPRYLQGDIDGVTLADDCDSARLKALTDGIDRGEVIATASGNFTCLETGLFIADVLKNKANADIGLCLVGTTHCGTVGRIYAGDICTADVSALSLSIGVTSGDPNDKKLWLVSMTGSEITDLLKSAYAYNPNDNVPNIPYYAASGLRIKFAPWAEKKLVSVTLENGKALDDDTMYNVALWGWPFDFKCQGSVLKVYSDSCDDILTEAIRRDGTIKPFNDGRFVIEYSK